VSLQIWNIGLLAAFGVFWLASGTQHEKPVLAATPGVAIQRFEADYRKDPNANHTRELAQAYLQMGTPGLAVGLLEQAPPAVRDDLETKHLYARALLDQGRATDALKVESEVEREMAVRCAEGANERCNGFLHVSAMRRAALLRELVALGIDDPAAHPEAAAVAYQHVSREARFAQ
jgi:hypothetical protein